MDSIRITFPKKLKPEKAKQLIEESVSRFSVYSCKLELIGGDEDENLYLLSSNDIKSFYLAGITAASILQILKEK